jgi:RNA 3'-terminal phosphate cyclase (ATP)
VLTLDGSYGEGGGQIVRAALSLAVALGRPVHITAVRARRRRPGLQPQHLTAVRALAEICDARVAGAALGSAELTFVPRALRPGAYRFDVGTAGAVALVFQALLFPLTRADGASEVILVGGTHVPWSPPFQYLSDVFLPALATMGVVAVADLRRWGWYPRGGGEVAATVVPRRPLRGFVAEDVPSGPVHGLSAVSRLPRSIAERQRHRAVERLAAAGVTADIDVQEDASALGAGTLVFLAMHGRAGFSALGRRGLPAEHVADAAADALLGFLASGAAIDDCLADQLLPFLALAEGSSSFTCPSLSSHLATVAWVVEQFLPRRVMLEPGPPARVRVR